MLLCKVRGIMKNISHSPYVLISENRNKNVFNTHKHNENNAHLLLSCVFVCMCVCGAGERVRGLRLKHFSHIYDLLMVFFARHLIANTPKQNHLIV